MTEESVRSKSVMDATGNCVKIASVARFVTDAVIVNQHCKHVLVMAVID